MRPQVPPNFLRTISDFERRIKTLERFPGGPYRMDYKGNVSGDVSINLMHTDQNLLVVATLTADTEFAIQGLRGGVRIVFLLTQGGVGGWETTFVPVPTTPRNEPLPVSYEAGDINCIALIVYNDTSVFAFLEDVPVGAGGGHVIKNETTPLAARSGLAFQGSGVVATDDSGGDQTIVTIAGGGSAPDISMATSDANGSATGALLVVDLSVAFVALGPKAVTLDGDGQMVLPVSDSTIDWWLWSTVWEITIDTTVYTSAIRLATIPLGAVAFQEYTSPNGWNYAVRNSATILTPVGDTPVALAPGVISAQDISTVDADYDWRLHTEVCYVGSTYFG